MGLKHGGYCLGCCWALMGLLFAFGVMNLLWVAGISILVLAEKIAPFKRLVSGVAGLVFLGWSAWIVFGPTCLKVVNGTTFWKHLFG
jgi:predicted metal-binding membrane protein